MRTEGGVRRLVATSAEREEASRILENVIFDGRTDDATGLWLHRYIQKRLPGAERILAEDRDEGAEEILDSRLPGTLVDLFGSEVFEGHHGGTLRKLVLRRLLAAGEYKKILNMFLAGSYLDAEKTEKVKTRFDADPEQEARKCMQLMNDKYRWIPGGRFAGRFVEQLGMADIYAGMRGSPGPRRVEEVVPRPRLDDLAPFQKNMKDQILRILEDQCGDRAIVTLPTGAGKTRLVVEAVVEFLNRHDTDTNILWIAHTQEVCEQAVLCFRQIWENRGAGKTLNIFRIWGQNDMPAPYERGVVVGGIQKLASQKDELRHLNRDGSLSAVLIDEAHHSVADSYVDILDGLGMSRMPGNGSMTPVLGITATPERRLGSETERLTSMYGNRRIAPDMRFEPCSESPGTCFDDRWKDLDFLRAKLEELEYLARAEFVPIEPGISPFKLDKRESADLDNGGEMWIRRMATEPERNRNIRNALLREAAKGRKILYFGTNVSQTSAMSKILEERGVRSACITGNTGYATRRMYVDAFNSPDDGDIQVLCNYNVLSTGFDSPQIDTVVIARPTTSIVSYQQMAGRGLRGSKFGGRKENLCRIITVQDNIRKFNDAEVDLGYAAFRKHINPSGVEGLH